MEQVIEEYGVAIVMVIVAQAILGAMQALLYAI